MISADRPVICRRRFLARSALAGAALVIPRLASSATVHRTIHTSGESIPAIGMGTWQTFNVGAVESLRKVRCDVLSRFFADGGTMVDSSPMYGSAEEVMGHCGRENGFPDNFFPITKVWTSSRAEGERQIRDSFDLWGVDQFALFQIHNLVGWQDHLPRLREMREAGRIRYVGITTSHGRRHAELETIMRNEPLDFVQLTYNLADREVEERLLPLAKDRGIAVIANRPFRRGALIDRLANSPLPPWAVDIGCDNLPQFLLKFIISHPAITCAIPATSRVDHMAQNMGALLEPLPDAGQRREMIRWLQSL